ncbi:MAG TPA: phage tail sheath family protein [candidate division Zixibacteria bacterium]|nr:phage tail sheath family protein [candidate division Zixibacteria bacterium]HEQ99590.1 phage tail sheath family protein [candidate division Zixibacteria bacterium]
MPEYLSPGVYVEEVDKGTKPLEAVGTSTAGFIGQSKQGPVNEATLITNWGQFTRTFGEFADSPYLAHAVYGFFNNGGARCFVTNVGMEGAPPPPPPPKKEDEDKKSPPPPSPGSKGGPSPALFIGKDGGPGNKTGLVTFEDIDEIAIVAAPGMTEPAIQDAVISHCEKMNRFAILDSEETIEKGGVDKIKKPRDSQYAGFYFPWIEVYDPAKDKNVYVPPSGHMAGIYARSDNTRGVHKAPANEVVRGALGLRYTISKGEQDILNPRGINCIRAFRDRGIRVWGARTVSSDPSWRYINVRRLFIMVEESIKNGTQWVVFEPNDHTLWKRIKRNITAFLLRVWNDGALFGQTPEQAFYVKCDEETNPPEVVDAGMVVIEIGMAPVKPAEFVIFRISQWQSGSSVNE